MTCAGKYRELAQHRLALPGVDIPFECGEEDVMIPQRSRYLPRLIARRVCVQLLKAQNVRVLITEEVQHLGKVLPQPDVPRYNLDSHEPSSSTGIELGGWIG